MKTLEVLEEVSKGKRLKPVFKQKSGGFYQDGDGLGHRVRYVVERAGIRGKKVGVHTLRHTSASLLARELMKRILRKGGSEFYPRRE
jgi:integrase